MKRFLTALGAALLCMASAQNTYRQQDFASLGGRWRPVFAWCDAPDRVMVVGQSGGGALDTPRRVTYARFLKSAPHNIVTRAYFLGPGEGAAGSIYVALSATLQKTPPATYFVHLSNVEQAGQDDDLASRVVEIKSPLDPNPGQCNYAPNAVFSGATGRRTVSVLKQYSGGYVYRSSDYGGGGVQIGGGKRGVTQGGRETYTFHNGGYTYRVEVDSPASPFARVVVSKGGKTLLAEAFRVYSDSRPRE